VASACAVLLRSGDANVDVVESFHFVEYSALALFFAWVFAPLAAPASWSWAGLAGVGVGVCDEWLQWFVPGRTGEIRDVGMNAVAVGCGLALAVALAPGWSLLRRGQALWLGCGAAALGIAVALFLTTVHLGYTIDDAEIGSFASRFPTDGLAQLAEVRSVQWGTGPVPAPGRFAREDQYLSEALWHVRRRNQALEHGPPEVAWREHRIVEKYYGPVLRVATPRGPAGHALAPEQVRTISVAVLGATTGQIDASPIPIYTGTATALWAIAVSWAASVVAIGAWVDRRISRPLHS
jgi:hypothetical protein